jgi:hypothetical protein
MLARKAAPAPRISTLTICRQFVDFIVAERRRRNVAGRLIHPNEHSDEDVVG